MTWHVNATIRRSVLLSAFFIASSAIALPAFGDDKKVSQGCTAAQIRSPEGTRCIEKGERDLLAKQPVHSLLCLGSDLQCCIREGNSFTHCEDLGRHGGPEPDITCADRTG
jgi:hypothetical protein